MERKKKARTNRTNRIRNNLNLEIGHGENRRFKYSKRVPRSQGDESTLEKLRELKGNGWKPIQLNII